MSPKLSTNPFDWLVSACDSIFGCIFLFSVGIGLGIFSLSLYLDVWELIGFILGWPILFVWTVVELWGLLIAPILVVVFWGMLYDIWNKFTLFAWSIVLGALMAVSLSDFEIGWQTLILLFPLYIFYCSYGSLVQRWMWKRKMKALE